MGHPDEGMIQALLDNEPVADQEALQAHLESCHQCRALAKTQESHLEILSQALPLLDEEPPIATARFRVLAKARGAEKSQEKRRIPLSLAASLAFLLTAGTLSALPGSPVRNWMTAQWGDSQLSGPSEPAASALPESQTSTTDLAGATILPTGEGVNLILRGVPDDAEVTVRFVDGNQAGIFAGAGTRFRTEEGSLEATDPPGPVRVEIPRGITSATLRVNGRIFLRQSSGETEIQSPVLTRTEDEIRFIPPGG